jgi:hypothetical protein
MIYKLTAPTDNTIRSNAYLGGWMVLGTAYTDNDNYAQRLGENGFDIEEVDEVPAEHSAKVDRLNAWPYPITVGQTDGANPDHKYRFEDHNGTWRDIRDLISGALTLRDSTHTGHAPLVRLDESKRV